MWWPKQEPPARGHWGQNALKRPEVNRHPVSKNRAQTKVKSRRDEDSSTAMHEAKRHETVPPKFGREIKLQ